MELYKNVKNGFIEMIFGPRWTYISTVRTFLQNFLSITLLNSKWADIISMAASELLENAVKYASDEGTKISIDHKKEENQLFLSVENFANENQIKTLQKEFKTLLDIPPEEAYLKKMQSAATRTDGGSQLGLARIRYEGNADIKLDVKNDLIKISVKFDLSE